MNYFSAYIFYPISAGHGLSAARGQLFQTLRLDFGAGLDTTTALLALDPKVSSQNPIPAGLCPAQRMQVGCWPPLCYGKKGTRLFPRREPAPRTALLCLGHKRAEQKYCLSSKLMSAYFYET